MDQKEIIILCIIIGFILFSIFQKNQSIQFMNSILGKLIIILCIITFTQIHTSYGLFFLLIIIIIFKIYDIDNIDDIGDIEEIQIPLDIYQTWYTKELPPKMIECVEKLKQDNPEFKHHLYDDEDCRTFIKNNFDRKVLNAFDSLIPGAYKADLWRYCILYKKGGIYLDVKFQCENGFKLIEMAKSPENYVLDRPFSSKRMPLKHELNLVNIPNYYDIVYNKIDTNFWKNKKIGIYNAVMASKPNNPVLKQCIDKIVENVNKQYYGYNALYPTGPGLLSDIYFGEDIRTKIKKIKYFNSCNGYFILNKKKKILSQYPEYRYEQQKYGKKSKDGENTYYDYLWRNKEIYK